MSAILPKSASLIIVDVQKGFDDPKWGKRNNPNAEANISKLLSKWRETHRPIYHFQHASLERDSPLRADKPGHEIKDIAKPRTGELLTKKNVNSCFIGTDLEQRLRKAGVDTVIIVGLTTDHCVATTTRMAGNLGFHTYVVSDATATFERVGPDGKHYSAEEMHRVNLASLHREFADVVDTATILHRLLTNPGE